MSKIRKPSHNQQDWDVPLDDALNALDSRTGAYRTKLIKLGQDIPNPTQFADNAALYDSRPFDGWVIDLPIYGGTWFTNAVLTEADILSQLDLFPTGLAKAQCNWLRLLITHSPDFTDDAAWVQIAANFAAVATALRNCGKQFDGIFLDTEFYGTGAGPWDWGSTTLPWSGDPSLGALPGTTADEARDLVIARGNQVMTAGLAVNPSLKVWTTYGPSVSDTNTFNQSVSGIYWANDVAWANELMGCFTYGIAQATYTEPNGQYLDGGEWGYEVRSATDAKILADWLRKGWADSAPYLIPSGETESYKACIGYAPAMYDLDSQNGYALHSAATLTELITLQLQQAKDGYAWLYTEHHEWGASGSGKPAVTSEYLAAVADALYAGQEKQAYAVVEQSGTTYGSRPAGVTKVTWFGLLDPRDNAVDGDEWSRAGAVRIRSNGAWVNPSDFYPGDLSNLVFWLDPDAMDGHVDTLEVDTFVDSSPNQYDFANADFAAEPKFHLNRLNSHAGLSFDGGDSLAAPSGSLAEFNAKPGITVIGVVKDALGNTGSTHRTWFSISTGSDVGTPRVSAQHRANGTDDIRYGAAGTRLDADTVATAQSAGTVNTSPHVESVVVDYANTSLKMWVDGTLVATNASFQTAGLADSTDPAVITMGGRPDGGEDWNGDIYPVLVFNRALTDTERQNVEAFLTAWAGL